MTLKTALPLIFALGAGTAAFAQDDAQTTGTDNAADYGSGGVPLSWDDDTRDAFFVDPGAEILLTETEIMNNWAGLTPEQQDAVRSHCMEVNMADEGAAAEGMEPAAPVTDMDETGMDETASVEGLGASAPMMQLCAMIETM
jgi:hypothetical protein